MKQIIYVILVLLIGVKSNGQNMNSEEISIYAVKHFDFFSFLKSEPNQKEWDFELSIKQIEENKFEACYSKELVNCLFHLNELRDEGISINEKGICFNYYLADDNSIKGIEKQEIVEYLEHLKQFQSSDYKKKKLKGILDNVDFYLKYEDELDKDLIREIKLIHEYEFWDIPIGVLGTIDEGEEEINFEELEDDEIDFLERINWERINRIDLYQTPKISESEFRLDYMFGLDLITVEERADFEEIAKQFFKGNFEVDDYENVTLNRDQRILNTEDKKLSFLLKQRRTVSSKMKKITRLEIRKK